MEKHPKVTNKNIEDSQQFKQRLLFKCADDFPLGDIAAGWKRQRPSLSLSSPSNILQSIYHPPQFNVTVRQIGLPTLNN